MDAVLTMFAEQARRDLLQQLHPDLLIGYLEGYFSEDYQLRLWLQGAVDLNCLLEWDSTPDGFLIFQIDPNFNLSGLTRTIATDKDMRRAADAVHRSWICDVVQQAQASLATNPPQMAGLQRLAAMTENCAVSEVLELAVQSGVLTLSEPYDEEDEPF